MNYIYAELNKDLLPKKLGVYYGFSVDIPTSFPITAQLVDDASHLQFEGWCKQKYSLGLSETAKYPYFIYPLKYGMLKHVETNQVFDIFINWSVNIITVDNVKYYLYYYNNQLAPGREVEYLFKIKSEEDAD